MNASHVFCASSAFLTGSQAVIGHGALPCIRHDTVLYHSCCVVTIPYRIVAPHSILHSTQPYLAIPASWFCLKVIMQTCLHKVYEVKFNLMREGGSQWGRALLGLRWSLPQFLICSSALDHQIRLPIDEKMRALGKCWSTKFSSDFWQIQVTVVLWEKKVLDFISTLSEAGLLQYHKLRLPVRGLLSALLRSHPEPIWKPFPR